VSGVPVPTVRSIAESEKSGTALPSTAGIGNAYRGAPAHPAITAAIATISKVLMTEH
jgi:hypothetical protein